MKDKKKKSERATPKYTPLPDMTAGRTPKMRSKTNNEVPVKRRIKATKIYTDAPKDREPKYSSRDSFPGSYKIDEKQKLLREAGESYGFGAPKKKKSKN